MIRVSVVAEGNAGIYETVDKIRDLLRRPSPRADRLAFFLRQEAGPSLFTRAASVHAWILEHVVYVPDEALISRAGLPADVEEFMTEPELMLTQVENHGQAEEDCDGFVLLTLALLQRLDVPACMVVASTRADRVYDHVSVAVDTEYGRQGMDGIYGRPFGWEAERVTARESLSV